MIRMNESLIHRPTSGATADALAAQLRHVRAGSHRLTENLSSKQLMGPMLPIINPVLWEIGHVGWFHEYWTLRHAHGEAPILDRADSAVEFEHGRPRNAMGSRTCPSATL